MSTEPQRQSWYQTLHELGPRQREVIDLLCQYGRPMSAWEIADLTKRLVHAVRPRLTELKGKGIVREAGARWEPRTQRHEAVWAVVPDEEDGQLRMAI